MFRHVRYSGRLFLERKKMGAGAAPSPPGRQPLPGSTCAASGEHCLTPGMQGRDGFVVGTSCPLLGWLRPRRLAPRSPTLRLGAGCCKKNRPKIDRPDGGGASDGRVVLGVERGDRRCGCESARLAGEPLDAAHEGALAAAGARLAALATLAALEAEVATRQPRPVW
jgi:hypothetical protein